MFPLRPFMICNECKVHLLGGNDELQKHHLDQHTYVYPIYIDSCFVSISRITSTWDLCCNTCSFTTPSFFGLINHLTHVHKKCIKWFDSDINKANHREQQRKRSHLASSMEQNGAAPKKARLASCMFYIKHGPSHINLLCR